MEHLWFFGNENQQLRKCTQSFGSSQVKIKTLLISHICTDDSALETNAKKKKKLRQAFQVRLGTVTKKKENLE